ncbi:MAG: nucleotide exchange factor GrpE [Desulfarculaceae bacterium]|jgi:molecular chaperone GrpE
MTKEDNLSTPETPMPRAEPEDLEPSIAVDESESDAQEILDPLAALTAERDELKDRVLRLAAEMDNYKKRSERDKADFLKRANESLVKDLLPIMDNLERALAHAEEQSEDTQGVTEGLSLIWQELSKVLERHGLEKVEALGLAFDPEVHEAMMQQEDPEAEENTVIQELQKGYLFQGRLLRPAMVVVSKKPSSQPDDGEEIKITVN